MFVPGLTRGRFPSSGKGGRTPWHVLPPGAVRNEADYRDFNRDTYARGSRVRLDRRAKNLKAVLDRAAAAGFRSFAFVNPETADASDLELKPLG